MNLIYKGDLIETIDIKKIHYLLVIICIRIEKFAMLLIDIIMIYFSF